jgi:hypothetical protein
MEPVIDFRGQVINPAPNCYAHNCIHQSSVRLAEEDEQTGKERRKDLCLRHALVMKRIYKDNLTIVATWNGVEKEDFDE